MTTPLCLILVFLYPDPTAWMGEEVRQMMDEGQQEAARADTPPPDEPTQPLEPYEQEVDTAEQSDGTAEWQQLLAYLEGPPAIFNEAVVDLDNPVASGSGLQAPPDESFTDYAARQKAENPWIYGVEGVQLPPGVSSVEGIFLYTDAAQTTLAEDTEPSLLLTPLAPTVKPAPTAPQKPYLPLKRMKRQLFVDLDENALDGPPSPKAAKISPDIDEDEGWDPEWDERDKELALIMSFE